MYRRLAKVLLVALVCQLSQAVAQTPPKFSGGISGQVRLPNNIPAPTGTLIVLERQDGGVVAQMQIDSQGKFDFRELDAMPYKVSIRVQGYEPQEQIVNLEFIPHAYLQINLKAIDAGKSAAVRAEGAGATVSVRDARIPAGAVKEFEKGKKLLIEDRDAAKAITHFQKAISVYQNFPQAHVLLGVAYLSQRKISEAEQAFQTAIQADEKSPDGYIALGTLQNQEQKFADAEKTLSKVVTLNPDLFRAQYELGKSYWALQRNDEAEPHARKALALEPKAPEAHVLMGNILLRKQDAAGAVGEYKEAVRLDPKGPYAGPTSQMIMKLEAAQEANPR
jgi:tetratricopeptide (TPR) repeat protein